VTRSHAAMLHTLALRVHTAASPAGGPVAARLQNAADFAAIRYA
jgi:hypothetical protein